jgi:hypothetical protein
MIKGISLMYFTFGTIKAVVAVDIWDNQSSGRCLSSGVVVLVGSSNGK